MDAVKLIRRLSGAIYFLLALSGLFLMAMFLLFFVVAKDLPQIPEPLSRINDTPPTEIYSSSGKIILVVGGKETTPLDSVSPIFIQAILSTEDHRFWEHHGVDKLRTVKALWTTLFVPGKIQGASTITQQLAKNLFFSFEKSYRRKIKELLAALQIEAQFSKSEILEAYINQIPFGPNAYGIGQAAMIFFGKTPAELTLSESSLLAGLPKSPSRYNPRRHFKRAKTRQRVVLFRMVATGVISQTEADAAYEAPIHLAPAQIPKANGSYFTDMILKRLEEKYGPDVVYHGGLKVQTTLDLQMQAYAEKAVEDGMVRLEDKMGVTDGSAGKTLQGALVAIAVETGAIKALVGGKDYAKTQYNRAVYSRRQPGSGFKPFLYYSAFEKLGVAPSEKMVDRPVKIPVPGAGTWRPKNFDKKNRGKLVVKKAFMESVNTVAAQLVEKVGPGAVIETAQRCGVDSPLNSVYSVALGSSGVSPLEMASSFSTFASGGIHHQPFMIKRVEDTGGMVLEEHITTGDRVLDAPTAFQVVDMMRGVVDEGTGNIVRKMGFELPAAGKTGTTNSFRDAWFTGFTPSLSVSVWVGFDKDHGMKDKNRVGVTGGRGAAPIWADFMKRSTAGEPNRDFKIPPGIHFKTIPAYPGQGFWTSDREMVTIALKPGQD